MFAKIQPRFVGRMGESKLYEYEAPVVKDTKVKRNKNKNMYNYSLPKNKRMKYVSAKHDSNNYCMSKGIPGHIVEKKKNDIMDFLVKISEMIED